MQGTSPNRKIYLLGFPTVQILRGGNAESSYSGVLSRAVHIEMSTPEPDIFIPPAENHVKTTRCVGEPSYAIPCSQ